MNETETDAALLASYRTWRKAKLFCYLRRQVAIQRQRTAIHSHYSAQESAEMARLHLRTTQDRCIAAKSRLQATSDALNAILGKESG